MKALLGKTFGSLTVIQEVCETRASAAGNRRNYALCLCSCGSKVAIGRGNLVCGNSTQCKSCATKTYKGRPRKGANWAVAHKLYSHYVKGARKREILWQLSYEEFSSLVFLPCHYCGTSGSMASKKYIYNVRHNGVDRVDSYGHYTPDNVVPCCKPCNIGKHTLSADAFIAHAKLIVAHQASKNCAGFEGH